MRKIVSSIDIGSDSIKLVVGETYENRLHILSASKVRSKGIERGKIIDTEKVTNSIKEAVKEASNTLGVEINKCILGLNMVDAKIVKSASAIKIKNESHTITSKHVTDLISKCADGKVPSDFVLANVVPVEFTVDGDKVVKHPVGVISENLGLKAIVISSPKEYVSSILDVVNGAGLKVIDVVPNALGDYYSFSNTTINEGNGVIVNIGNEVTSITVFEKGIIDNFSTIPLGAKNIVNDIAYVNKIDESDAEAIYNDIVLATSRLANSKEYRTVVDLNGKEIKLNQYEMSEIAFYRIQEILNLVKKQINVLTKKEISYIIVSGGLSESKDFNLALSDAFGKEATVGKLNFIGARDNSYSSAVGILKYFDWRLELKGKAFSIFSSSDIDLMNDMGRDVSINNNSLLSKVFGYFFDN